MALGLRYLHGMNTSFWGFSGKCVLRLMCFDIQSKSCHQKIYKCDSEGDVGLMSPLNPNRLQDEGLPVTISPPIQP